MSALERSTYRFSECSSGTYANSAQREKVRSASNGYGHERPHTRLIPTRSKSVDTSAPLVSSAKGVETWLETATAVDVRFDANGNLAVLALCGRDDLLQGVRRRTRRGSVEEFAFMRSKSLSAGLNLFSSISSLASYFKALSQPRLRFAPDAARARKKIVSKTVVSGQTWRLCS